MKLKEFKKNLRNYPYFTSAVYGALTASPHILHNQVGQWVKSGDVIRLRRGLYTLSDPARGVGLSKKLIANVLYSPSYISLEYALAYYDMIPEAVFAVTSVTTKKTQTFTNEFGHFIYKNIKRRGFTGFRTVKDEFGFGCLMATPEKALLDYLYYNIPASQKIDADYFEESLRLQNQEEIDLEKMTLLLKELGSQKMFKIGAVVKEWIERSG